MIEIVKLIKWLRKWKKLTYCDKISTGRSSYYERFKVYVILKLWQRTLGRTCDIKRFYSTNSEITIGRYIGNWYNDNINIYIWINKKKEQSF